MNLLWAFNFTPSKDPLSGETIPVDINDIREESVLLVPKPFQCEVVPRREARAESVRKQFKYG
ncbi:hypothetical protein QCA50_004137 [Cerrena zonata]|uniref:Uncharacterized protein n=1 Tax=Cerrena zonata TaxID=2478898 RepID=A0AAW0GN47_9APHY